MNDCRDMALALVRFPVALRAALLVAEQSIQLNKQLHLSDVCPDVEGQSHTQYLQVQLRDRPSLSLDDLNWDDHSCYQYSSILDNTQGVTILANATAEVAQPPSMASSD